jgi:hypothetical protein
MELFARLVWLLHQPIQDRVPVGRMVSKYKVAKHFDLEIEDERLAFRIREDQVAKAATTR